MSCIVMAYLVMAYIVMTYRSAKAGFARAQNELGMAHKTGDGCRQDLDKVLF